MDKYFHDEKFEFLVFETFDLGCYGFNLKCTDERATAKEIIQDVNSFIVNGRKVARQIPKWINCYNAWNSFMNVKCSGNKSEEYYSEEDANDDDNKDFEYDKEEEGEDDEKVEEDGQEEEEEKEVEEEGRRGQGRGGGRGGGRVGGGRVEGLNDAR